MLLPGSQQHVNNGLLGCFRGFWPLCYRLLGSRYRCVGDIGCDLGKYDCLHLSWCRGPSASSHNRNSVRPAASSSKAWAVV